MTVGPDPDRRGVPLQVGRHVGSRNHGAVDHVSRYPMRIPDEMLAHRRTHAVAAYDRSAFVDLAAAVDEAHAVLVHVDLGDARGGVHANRRGKLHLLVHRHVDIGAMDDCVGIVETSPKCFADGYARDFTAIDRVHHHKLIGVYRASPCPFADAQCIQRSEAVGAELQPSADFSDLCRLLEDIHGEALLVQRQRAGHSADAASYDQHRCAIALGRHGVSAARRRRACAAAATRQR